MSTAFASPAMADDSAIILQFGSTGSAVAQLQGDLQDLGYFPKSEGITQYFGPVTSHAVVSYKHDHRLGTGDKVNQTVFKDIQDDAAKVSKKVSPPSSFGERLADKAVTYVGDPYAWGGTSPSGFDCSGFTQYVFAEFGISLPRTTSDQSGEGSQVSESQLQPGDLVFFDTYGGVSHVGIYIGGGKFVNAASTQVEVDSLYSEYWSSHFLFGRHVS